MTYFDFVEEKLSVLRVFCENVAQGFYDPYSILGGIVSMRKALELIVVDILHIKSSGKTTGGVPNFLKCSPDDIRKKYDSPRVIEHLDTVFLDSDDRSLFREACQLIESISIYCHYLGYVLYTDKPLIKGDTVVETELSQIQEMYSQYPTYINQFIRVLCNYLDTIGQSDSNVGLELDYSSGHQGDWEALRDRIKRQTLLEKSPQPMVEYCSSIIKHYYRSMDCNSILIEDTLVSCYRIIAERYGFFHIQYCNYDLNPTDPQLIRTWVSVSLAENEQSGQVGLSLKNYGKKLEELSKDESFLESLRRDDIRRYKERTKAVQVIADISNDFDHIKAIGRIESETETSGKTVGRAFRTLTLLFRKPDESFYNFLDRYSLAAQLVVAMDAESKSDGIKFILNNRGDYAELIKRIKKQHLLNIIAWCITTIAIIVVSIYCFVSCYESKLQTKAYRDYVWRNGIPEGIYPLSKDELSTFSSYYEIDENNGTVVELRHVNNAGRVVSESVFPERAPIVKISADNGQGRIIGYFDENNQEIFSIIYSGGDFGSASFYLMSGSGVISLPPDWSRIDMLAWRSSLDGENNGHALYSGVHAVDVTYTVGAMQVSGVNRSADRFGVTGYLINFEKDSGRIRSIIYDYDPAVSLDPWSIKSKIYVYDANNGYSLSEVEVYCEDRAYDYRIEYDWGDGKSNLVYGVHRKNHMSEYVEDQYGVASTIFEYNDGNISKVSFFDANGTPVIGSEGYSYKQYTYSAKGEINTEVYYDAHSNLVRPTGYEWAKRVVTYQQNDEEPYEWLYDENDVLIDVVHTIRGSTPGTEGYTELVMHCDDECVPVRMTKKWYDRYNQCVKMEYLDGSGEPRRDIAYTSVEMIREQGKVLREIYRDADNQLISNGHAIRNSVYDAYGREIEAWYQDNHPENIANPRINLTHRDGAPYARITWVFDSTYNDSQTEKYYDISEERTFETTTIRTVNSRGVGETFFGYDMRGQLVMYFTYDLQHNPTIADGESSYGIMYEYDNRGFTSSTTFLGSDKKPMISQEYGYARIEEINDGQGRIIEERYFDEIGDAMPSADEDAVYGVRYLYDDFGYVSVMTYLGKDGYPTISQASRIATFRYTNDSRGNVTLESRYDTNDDPTIWDGDGAYGLRLKYNEYDFEISRTFLNHSGDPMVSPVFGYASVERQYDAQENIILEKYYDEIGNLIVPPYLTYAGFTATYDGNAIHTIEYYDEGWNQISPTD